MFGGNNTAAGFLSDTWDYDGGVPPTPNWTAVITINNPSGRQNPEMTYDSARGVAVLFGGEDVIGGPSLNDTWEYDGVDWTQITTANSPSGRGGHAMAYDSARGKVVMFGGSSGGDETWEYDGVDWTAVMTANNPSARSGHGMSYDSGSQKIILVGGWDGTTNSADMMYEYDGVDWTQITTVNSPSGRHWPGLVYDSVRGKTVLFGGWSTFYQNDTWEYDGADWTQITTASSPGIRGAQKMVYDSARGKTVMFGGFSFLAFPAPFFDDTWEYDGVDWAQITTATTPAGRSVQAMTYDSARGQTVMFGGNNTAPGFLGDTWDYAPSYPTASTSIPASSPTGCNGALVHYTVDSTGAPASWESGTTAVLTVTNLDPAFNLGILVFGNQANNLSILGGLLIPSPDVVSLISGSGGVASLSVTIPPGLGGNTFYSQFAGFDSCVAVGEMMFSNGQSHLLP
jgi:hypothetical protein